MRVYALSVCVCGGGGGVNAVCVWGCVHAVICVGRWGVHTVFVCFVWGCERRVWCIGGVCVRVCGCTPCFVGV